MRHHRCGEVAVPLAIGSGGLVIDAVALPTSTFIFDKVVRFGTRTRIPIYDSFQDSVR